MIERITCGTHIILKWWLKIGCWFEIWIIVVIIIQPIFIWNVLNLTQQYLCTAHAFCYCFFVIFFFQFFAFFEDEVRKPFSIHKWGKQYMNLNRWWCGAKEVTFLTHSLKNDKPNEPKIKWIKQNSWIRPCPKKDKVIT